MSGLESNLIINNTPSVSDGTELPSVEIGASAPTILDEILRTSHDNAGDDSENESRGSVDGSNRIAAPNNDNLLPRGGLVDPVVKVAATPLAYPQEGRRVLTQDEFSTVVDKLVEFSYLSWVPKAIEKTIPEPQLRLIVNVAICVQPVKFPGQPDNASYDQLSEYLALLATHIRDDQELVPEPNFCSFDFFNPSVEWFIINDPRLVAGKFRAHNMIPDEAAEEKFISKLNLPAPSDNRYVIKLERFKKFAYSQLMAMHKLLDIENTKFFLENLIQHVTNYNVQDYSHLILGFPLSFCGGGNNPKQSRSEKLLAAFNEFDKLQICVYASTKVLTAAIGLLRYLTHKLSLNPVGGEGSNKRQHYDALVAYASSLSPQAIMSGSIVDSLRSKHEILSCFKILNKEVGRTGTWQELKAKLQIELGHINPTVADIVVHRAPSRNDRLTSIFPNRVISAAKDSTRGGGGISTFRCEDGSDVSEDDNESDEGSSRHSSDRESNPPVGEDLMLAFDSRRDGLSLSPVAAYTGRPPLKPQRKSAADFLFDLATDISSTTTGTATYRCSLDELLFKPVDLENFGNDQRGETLAKNLCIFNPLFYESNVCIIVLINPARIGVPSTVDYFAPDKTGNASLSDVVKYMHMAIYQPARLQPRGLEPGDVLVEFRLPFSKLEGTRPVPFPQTMIAPLGTKSCFSRSSSSSSSSSSVPATRIEINYSMMVISYDLARQLYEAGNFGIDPIPKLLSEEHGLVFSVYETKTIKVTRAKAVELERAAIAEQERGRRSAPSSKRSGTASNFNSLSLYDSGGEDDSNASRNSHSVAISSIIDRNSLLTRSQSLSTPSSKGGIPGIGRAVLFQQIANAISISDNQDTVADDSMSLAILEELSGNTVKHVIDPDGNKHPAKVPHNTIQIMGYWMGTIRLSSSNPEARMELFGCPNIPDKALGSEFLAVIIDRFSDNLQDSQFSMVKDIRLFKEKKFPQLACVVMFYCKMGASDSFRLDDFLEAPRTIRTNDDLVSAIGKLTTVLDCVYKPRHSDNRPYYFDLFRDIIDNLSRNTTSVSPFRTDYLSVKIRLQLSYISTEIRSTNPPSPRDKFNSFTKVVNFLRDNLTVASLGLSLVDQDRFIRKEGHFSYSESYSYGVVASFIGHSPVPTPLSTSSTPLSITVPDRRGGGGGGGNNLTGGGKKRTNTETNPPTSSRDKRGRNDERSSGNEENWGEPLSGGGAGNSYTSPGHYGPPGAATATANKPPFDLHEQACRRDMGRVSGLKWTCTTLRCERMHFDPRITASGASIRGYGSLPFSRLAGDIGSMGNSADRNKIFDHLRKVLH